MTIKSKGKIVDVYVSKSARLMCLGMLIMLFSVVVLFALALAFDATPTTRILLALFLSGFVTTLCALCADKQS